MDPKDEQNDQPASVDQSVESAPAQTEPQPAPTFDTAKVMQELEDVFESQPKEETPPKPTEETPPKAEDAPDKGEPKDQNADQEPQTKAPEEEDLDADPPELDRKDPRLEKIGRRLDKLRARHKAEREQLQNEAAFGTSILKMAKDVNLPPNDLAAWNNLGARVHLGDPQAIEELAAITMRLGWTPPQPAKTDTQTVDALAGKLYTELFADDVKNLEVDETFAKAKARKLAEMQMANAPKPQQPVQPRPQPSAQQYAPPQMTEDQIVARRTQDELQRRYVEYSKTIPNFKEIHAEAAKRVEKIGPENIPVMDRPAYYTNLITTIQRERANAAKRTPPTSTGLRSSSTTTATNAKPGTMQAITQELVNDKDLWQQ